MKPLKAHFTIKVGETVASEEEIGTIIEQSPDSTHSVKAETTEITVTLSGGPAQEETTEITLEDYTDGTHDYRQVKSQLESLGLKTKCEGEYSDDVDEYKIIRTDPWPAPSWKREIPSPYITARARRPKNLRWSICWVRRRMTPGTPFPIWVWS